MSVLNDCKHILRQLAVLVGPTERCDHEAYSMQAKVQRQVPLPLIATTCTANGRACFRQIFRMIKQELNVAMETSMIFDVVYPGAVQPMPALPSATY